MPTVIFQYTKQDANDELTSTWENLQFQSHQTEVLELGSPPGRSGGSVINPFTTIIYKGCSGKLYSHNEQSTGTPPLPHLRFEIGDRKFDWEDEDKISNVVYDTIDLIKKVYLATNTRPVFVYGMAKKMPGVLKELGSYPIPASQVGEDVSEIQFVSWLSIFPPSLVDTYGRERLLSAPAWHVEELDDGSILLVGWKDPTEVGGGDLREYFGLSTEE